MLTEKEKRKINAINEKNAYGLSTSELKEINAKHKKARAEGDAHTMEAIEYRLTDINFHTECSLMARGEYDKVGEIIKNWED